MDGTISVVNIIQAMLAPGLMISACGLLILGMNNKYSMVVTRIRLLSEEWRRIKSAGGGPAGGPAMVRLDSVSAQLDKSLVRLKLVRNAVFCYSLSVAFFIFSSLFIGLRLLTASRPGEWLILLFFIAGVLTVLCGVGFAAREVWHGYRIVEVEVGEIS